MTENNHESNGFGLLRAHFRDVDEFNETVRGWNTDFRRVDPGALNAGPAQCVPQHANMASARFGRVIAQRGGAPPDMRTFAIRHDRLPWLKRGGQEVKKSVRFIPSTGK